MDSENSTFTMPVAPAYGNGGFGMGGDWSWILLLVSLCGGGWGGFGGGFCGGYSNRSRDSYRDSYLDSYRYDDGMSMRRRRDSRGRYASRYSVREDYIEHLRGMMEDAPDEQTRQSIQRMIQQMEQQ